MIRRLTAVICGITPFVFTSLALAQGGSLSYGPVGQAIPAGNSLWLALLAILVVGFGLSALHLRGKGRGMTTLLVVASSLIALAGGFYVQDAGAPPASVELSNPQGGAVAVPVGPLQYINTSGIALRVNAISEPCQNGINKAVNACTEAKVLAENASCETDFVCPQPEICDGQDNNFNDLIDDGVTPPLGLSCLGGPAVCTGAGGWVCPPSCTPDCNGKACGDDGCGGSCGSCSSGSTCTPAGSCQASVCGDLSCDAPENSSNCPVDCGLPG